MSTQPELPPDHLNGDWAAGSPSSDSLSVDGDLWWEAVLNFLNEDDWGEPSDPDRQVEVGLCRPPIPPENLLQAHRVLDDLQESGHDDYSFEDCGCEAWLAGVTPEQQQQLQNLLRAALGTWLDEHNLRPTWKVVGRTWTVTAAQAMQAQARALSCNLSPSQPST